MHQIHAFSEDSPSRLKTRELPHEFKEDAIVKNNRFRTIISMEIKHASIIGSVKEE
jgi:hypothetical protein